MELSDRRPPELSTSTSGFRHFAVCAALVALAVIQTPGRVVSDTKLDLVVDPGGFMLRALSMWDGLGFFGQLQNQAYGYLFPLGPFFLAGDLIDVPPWVIQRGWWALVLCVAYLGVVKLCAELGVGGTTSRVVAGIFFALSPRMLSVLGWHSIETWPTAVAPWVLVPLVIGIKRGSTRRMAALSALAVFSIGGVNAAATFAATPLAAGWLLMAPAGPRRRSLLLWWPLLVILAISWWLGPLMLLGAYSPPFLDFIESSETATLAATPLDALRGTTNWVPYISLESNAGRDVLANPVVILNAGVLTCLGLVGLASPTLKHRGFLITAVLVGIVAVSLGHVGTVDGWAASWWQARFDGVLAPLRNNHKFDVLIRLPLAIAVAHTVASIAAHTKNDEAPYRRWGAGLVVSSALLGATMPAWSGRLANDGSFDEIPAHWVQASQWLGANATGSTLLLPSSAFGDYAWGTTSDEPIQPLATSAWAVRNAVPLTSASTIRWLDSVTDQVAQAESAPTLAVSLARAGVSHLLVRNDLRPDVAGGRVESVYATLELSDGFSKVASFGPEIGGAGQITVGNKRTFARGGWQEARPAVEIYRVDPLPSDSERSVSPIVVAGASDALIELERLGIIDSDVLLARDQPEDLAAQVVLTDGLRRQEVAFGSVDRLRSPALATTDDYVRDRRLHDYLEAADDPWITETTLAGVSSIHSPRSRSSVDYPGPVTTGALPFAAVDGDQRSAWQAWTSEGQLSIEFEEPQDLSGLSISAGLAPGETQTITVKTASAERSATLVGEQGVVLELPEAQSLTISGQRHGGQPMQITEISIPGLEVTRTLRLPEVPESAGRVSSIVVGLGGTRRPGCIDLERASRCRHGIGDRGEDAYLIDRVVTMHEDLQVNAALTARAFAGPELDQIVQSGNGALVTVSSSINDDPRAGASVMLDAKSSTAWIANPGDTDPTISVTSESAMTVETMRISTAPEIPASRVGDVTIRTASGEQRQAVVRNGWASFEPVTSDRFEIYVRSDQDASNYVGDQFSTVLPVGVSTLEFGVATQIDLADRVETQCGTGPTIVVNGRGLATSVTSTRGELLSGRPIEVNLCGPGAITLRQGENRIVSRASGVLEAGSVVFTAAEPADSALGVPIVNLRHNANPGWASTRPTDQAVTVNGWQQGFIVTEETAPVNAVFGPEQRYRLLLGVGALGPVLVAAIALRSRRERHERDISARSATAPWLVFVLSAMAAIAMVAGGWGIAVAVAGAVIVRWGEPHGVSSKAVVAIGFMTAIVMYTLWPWGHGSQWAGNWMWPHYLAVFVMGVLVSSEAFSRDRPYRMAGNSIQR